jgi:putative aldouronate transport system permease protein
VITSKTSKAGDALIVLFCLALIALCLAPIVHIAAKSLSSTDALIRNEVGLWPKGLSGAAYALMLEDGKFVRALWWTALLTVIGTCLSLVVTTMAAYPLTYDGLKGKRVINALFIVTMFFNAGIIPMYVLLKKIGYVNKPVVLIVPYCLSMFNMILMRSFMCDLPVSMRESAEIDGAGPIRVLWSIYLPLCKPAIATLVLFYAVGRWNGFSDALMFVTSEPKYFPIQLLLYNLINAVQSIDTASLEGTVSPALGDSLKAAGIMFATVPILCLYIPLQKYFIAGATLGAVKE